MSQHTDGVNKASWFLILQDVAHGVGYFLCIGGWLFFSCLVIFVSDFIINPDSGRSLKEIHSFYGDRRVAFSAVGYFLVSGWLLLRFAVGLFPFSRRVFK
jgi:hypothetical protein